MEGTVVQIGLCLLTGTNIHYYAVCIPSHLLHSFCLLHQILGEVFRKKTFSRYLRKKRKNVLPFSLNNE